MWHPAGKKALLRKMCFDSRRRIWIDAKTQTFGSFVELNAWLDARCRTLWSEIAHPDYTGVTLAEALEQEQIYLMPMPTPFDGYVEVVARVSSTCLVTVERNQYSVPCHLANSKAAIHLYADRVDVCTEKAIIARHQRLLGRDQVSKTGNTTFRCLKENRAPYATERRLPSCRCPLPNCKPLYVTGNGNKVIGL